MGTGMRGMNMAGMATIGIMAGTVIVTIVMVIIGTTAGKARVNIRVRKHKGCRTTGSLHF